MTAALLDKLILLVIVFIPASAAHAQLAAAHFTSFEKKELWYDRIVGRENTTVFNGSEYFIAFQGGPTHPFFGTLSASEGRLWYDGQYFPDVQLIYDIYTDMLVIRHRDKEGLFSMISLDQNKVQAFTLNNHYFKKLTNSKPPAGHPENKYYDILFKGTHLMLVAKRMKGESKTTTMVEYELNDRYFFIKDGNWFPVRGLRDVVALDQSKGQEIVKFVKSSHIKLRKLDEPAIQDVANFVDSLLTKSPSK